MMSIQYYDRKKLAAIVADVWQNSFDTELDPADGRWFVSGPGENNGGLIGNLTDVLATELTFEVDPSAHVVSSRPVDAEHQIFDNRNGLMPEGSASLSYTYQHATTTTHAATNGLKFDIGCEYKAKTEFQEMTAKFNFEYSYSWTDTTSQTSGESKTFTQTVPVRNIPAGKVYQVVLMCDDENMDLPFRTYVYLSGTSTANFSSRINGKTQHAMTAGELCNKIKEFKSAGTDSDKFGQDPKDPSRGYIRIDGVVRAQRTTNFTARVLDVTASFPPDGTVAPSSSSLPGNPVREHPLQR